jgi:hypothetical protein
MTVNTIIRSIVITIISIILGVLIGLAFSNGAIPFLRGIVKAVLILATVLLSGYVATTVLTYFMSQERIKICLVGPGITFLIADIGTLVTGILALGVVLNAASTPIVILIGFGGFFFSLMMLATLLLVICLVSRTTPGDCV